MESAAFEDGLLNIRALSCMTEALSWHLIKSFKLLLHNSLSSWQSLIVQLPRERKRERGNMCCLKCSMGLFKDFCCSSASAHQGQKRKRAPLFLSGEDRKGQERKSEERGIEIFRDATGQLLPQSLLFLSIDPWHKSRTITSVIRFLLYTYDNPHVYRIRLSKN